MNLKYYYTNCLISFYASQQGLGRKEAINQSLFFLRKKLKMDIDQHKERQQTKSDFQKMEKVAKQTVLQSRTLRYFHEHIFSKYFHLYTNYLLKVSITD